MSKTFPDGSDAAGVETAFKYEGFSVSLLDGRRLETSSSVPVTLGLVFSSVVTLGRYFKGSEHCPLVEVEYLLTCLLDEADLSNFGVA